MDTSLPIGIFDSGAGGLTVAKAIMELLPNENLVYLGDTARYPYGPRHQEEVRGFATQIMEYLTDTHSVKFLVVGCNTAAAALEEMDASAFPVPYVGVIEPGVRALISASQKGNVGVIGTTGTISSGAYQRAIQKMAPDIAPDIESHFLACPGFVEFVERDQTDSLDIKILAERLLEPVKSAEVDTLLLGCTHYPFLAKTISGVLGEGVKLVSSAEETAGWVKHILEQGKLLNPEGSAENKIPQREWIVTGEDTLFLQLAEKLLVEKEMNQIKLQIRPWS